MHTLRSVGVSPSACALFATLSLATVTCSSGPSASLTQTGSVTQALDAGTSVAHIASGKDATLCLAANDTSNGAKLTLAPCTATQALTWAQPGQSHLKLGDKCLDVADGRAADGASVQLWDCFDNNSNQQWSVVGKQLMWVGHNLCLDLKDGVTGPQAALQIWTCGTANVNQQWTLQEGGSASDTSPSAAPTAGSLASGTRASCKRGIAADAGQALHLTAADLGLLSSNVTWWYNWYLQPGDSSVVAANSTLAMDYVQMVSVKTTNFSDLEANVSPNARYLLTFNEPNFNSQSNVTPQEAAALWPKIEAFANKHNLLIVSPAMNYCSSGCNVGDPFDWLDQFFAACSGCRVDHIAVHAYTCDVSNLQSMSIDPFVKKYNKPIWLTEFDCADNGVIRNDVPSQKAYMAASLAMLEAHPNVFRYAWFMGKADGGWSNIALLNDNGGLTELGKYYLSLPQACTP